MLKESLNNKSGRKFKYHYKMWYKKFIKIEYIYYGAGTRKDKRTKMAVTPQTPKTESECLDSQLKPRIGNLYNTEQDI